MKAPLSKKVIVLIKKGDGHRLVEKIRKYEQLLAAKNEDDDDEHEDIADSTIGKYRLILSK
ncbi:MAG: hypothetical protein K0M50_04550 [Prolixibacteraceae bacterium]|nr:hypothetical protein [Prolixibacteraceae bacterium]